MEFLKTNNTQHGFFHAIQTVSEGVELSTQEAEELFDYAGQELIKCMARDNRRFGPVKAKNWLDGRPGRFLVEALPKTKPSVLELKKAIAKEFTEALWIHRTASQA